MANVACVYLLQAAAVWKGLEANIAEQSSGTAAFFFLDFVAQEFASTLLDDPHVSPEFLEKNWHYDHQPEETNDVTWGSESGKATERLISEVK